MSDHAPPLVCPRAGLRWITGDSLEVLKGLPDEAVDCAVTSPPYWRLRRYGVAGEIGNEATVDEYVGKLVALFREVRRVLKRRGTLWLNLGDTWAGGGLGGGGSFACDGLRMVPEAGSSKHVAARTGSRLVGGGLKRKDLVGVPWRVALALQEDGWYLRQDIIWRKLNPMPESVRDRCTHSHEYIFLLSRSPKYWFDAKALHEPTSGTAHPRGCGVNPKSFGAGSRVNVDRDTAHQTPGRAKSKQNRSFSAAVRGLVGTRNARSVWGMALEPYYGQHFATFPRELPRRCILAGCPAGGIVLDPFAGSGTTGEVALQLGRRALMVDLDPRNEALMRERTSQVQPELLI